MNLLEEMSMLRSALREDPKQFATILEKFSLKLNDKGVHDSKRLHLENARTYGNFPESVAFTDYVSMYDQFTISVSFTDEEIVNEIFKKARNQK